MPSVRVVPEGRLVYGMQLPIQSQSRLYVADWELASGPKELELIARKADETGVFYVGVCDHVVIPRERAEAMGTVWYDPVATLGMLAGVTSNVRLLSHVFVPAYRHPLVAAKSFATLDHLSRGRAIVGVGAGHVQGEFEALGVDFAQRGKLLDEAIDLIADALTNEFIDDVGLGPRPVQRPRPPIWVGGSSRPALRRAAERGDGWLPQGTPRADLPTQIAYLLAHRRRVRGDDPIEIGTIAEPVYVGKPFFDRDARTLTGSPDKIAASLRALGEMGVSHIQVRFIARSLDEQLDQMDAFAKEVAPLLN